MSLLTIISSFAKSTAVIVEPPPPPPPAGDNDTSANFTMTKRSDAVTDFVRDGTKTMQVGSYLYSFGGWNPYEAGNVFSDVYRSSGDLSSWTKRTNAPWHGRHTFGIGSMGGYVYVFGGDSYQSLFDVWRTADGDTWELLNSNVFQLGNRVLYGYCVHNNYLFVLGGELSLNGTPGFPDVWRSADGITWTQIATNLPFVAKNITGGVASFNGKIYVLSGGLYDSGNYSQELWSSADGIAWQQEANLPFAGRYYHDCVVWKNKLWVVGGYNNASGNLKDIWFMKTTGVWEQYTGVPNAYEGRHATGVAVFEDKLVISNGNFFNDCWVIEKTS